MGGDGGSIPRREELVRTKKKAEQIQKEIEDYIRWRACAITQQDLKEPVVACELGRLYNKDSVIECVLNKQWPENCTHIRSMKDVKVLNLTKNPAFVVDKSHKGDEARDFNVAEWICPVVGLEMNGNCRFYVNWNCGCVLSEKAVKEVKTDACFKCGKDFSAKDLILLNPTDEAEIAKQRQQMEDKRAAAKEQKRSKKSDSSNGNTTTESVCKPSSADDVAGVSAPAKKKPQTGDKRKLDIDADSSGKEAAASNKRLSSSASAARSDPERSVATWSKIAQVKESFNRSIQEDPRASKVLKSLFTSSETAKKQDHAHWTTYNPFYN